MILINDMEIIGKYLLFMEYWSFYVVYWYVYFY